MPPLSVMVKPVSGRCNMRCSYCFYADEMQNRSTSLFPVMTEDTLETLVRRIFSYADGSISLAFQGGEPTLAGRDFYRRLLALEKQYNTRGVPVQHALQTNGYALDDALLSVCREGQFLLGISLDGTQPLHDEKRLDSAGNPTWERIQENIRRIRQAGIPYNILCVVDERAARQGGAVFEALRPHGYIQFIPCLDGLDGGKGPDALTAESYGQFLIDTFRLYEKGFRSNHFCSVRTFDNWLNMLCGRAPESCGMLGRCTPSFLVESSGDVYPCDFYALDNWRMGNIHRDSFFRMAKSDTARRFAETSLPVDEACRVCEWAFLCHGGCRREREPFSGGKPQRNRLCEGLKMFFTACYPALEALSRKTAPAMPKQF